MQVDPLRPSVETRAPPILVRATGLLMSSFGVALAMVGVWMVYRFWVLDRFGRVGAWLLLMGTVITATFCLLIGSRLFFVRPNRYGSLLTPRGWRILGSVFYSTAVAAVLAALVSGRYELLLTCPLAAGFAVVCIRAASRLGEK